MGNKTKSTEGRGFLGREFTSGVLFDSSLSMYPSVMRGFGGGSTEFAMATSTYFGIVREGEVKLIREGLPEVGLARGMYFSATGSMTLKGDGQVMLVERLGYRGLFTVGGPIEDEGRLVYVDDCSVSQLIPPVRLGDPTFQMLVFPPGVNQTQHIHPTLRFGMVLRGHGTCHLPNGINHDLRPGITFLLEERFPHCFSTTSESMTVIAYHPDSDVGPTDHEHPMLSRTYIRKD